ncbi:hypothetical protein M1P97_19995 [Parabacteroides sp. GYB001]|uniref:hypothetical protein n=1 Tax=Parabacteroides leei TaxID=2939491 RepID=UPI0020181D4B|nr:hypothetical protein [Parabacteroides leei]MCL3853569.1 hypothetical protein [Parabacteroides leei]
MTPITIEGVILTEELIGFIKQCQKDTEFMYSHLEAIDNAITLIACDCNPEKGKEKEALNTIADLSFLKRYIRLFERKEDK